MFLLYELVFSFYMLHVDEWTEVDRKRGMLFLGCMYSVCIHRFTQFSAPINGAYSGSTLNISKQKYRHEFLFSQDMHLNLLLK